MKKLAYILWVVLLASSLVSCVFPGYKLKPGDKIGDMTITNEWESGVLNFNEICSFEELTLDDTCEIPASITKFGISRAWAEDTQEALDLAWSSSKWEMTFDGHKVDLEPFGTFDMELGGQKVRAWNVYIVNPAPGKHEVRYDFNIENTMERGNHNTTFIFTVMAPDQVGDSSPSTTTPTLIQFSDEFMVEPGDNIGDFLITTGAGKDITYVWNLHSECVKQDGVENYSCNVNTDTKMNVSWGVYASFDTDLDTMWSEHTYKMFIDNRPVNLEAFGSIDVRHPTVGPMRHWNVVIVASKPGEITVRTEAVVDGEPSEDTKTLIFSAP